MFVCLLALASKQAERIQLFCTNKSFVISLGGTIFVVALIKPFKANLPK